jgi:LmbE family N-acetylglucosaminyl deacetylase
MTTLVVSPHLDDAVLSCGEALQHADVTDATVVTIFAGLPESDLPLTNFDVQSGYTSARAAVLHRRLEDARATSVLGVTGEHLGFFDRQYGKGNDVDEIVGALVVLLEQHAPDALWVPLGLLHPDHELVGRCARAAAAISGIESLTVYEELPGRVIADAVALARAQAQLYDDGWQVDRPVHVARNERTLAVKNAALHCYGSQLWALDMHSCLVPERLWDVSRAKS